VCVQPVLTSRSKLDLQVAEVGREVHHPPRFQLLFRQPSRTIKNAPQTYSILFFYLS
jgi:hypothetical protein